MQKVTSSIKRKAIIVFLISSFALIGLYFVYKFAFNDIYKTVADLSYPNQKLTAVNNLFFEISRSEKSFRDLIATEKEKSFDDFISNSNSIKQFSDSLRLLCVNDTQQINLIDSINDLIEMRKIVLLKYLKYRKSLKNNNPITKQMHLLDSITSVVNSNGNMLVRTEQKKITTKLDTLEVEIQPDKKSLWSKLFKRSKKNTIKIEKREQEDINTKIDTILLPNQKSNSSEVQKIISDISKSQNVSRDDFLSREAELNEFEKSFNSQITELLSNVEKDVINQTSAVQHKAESVINRSILRIDMIMIFFFLSTATIVVLILLDATKSNKYRLLLEKAKEDAEYQTLAKQRFLSNMSHEIRTPLQSIIGYSEQLKNGTSQNTNYIAAIQHSSEHLLQVVNEILDYSRINSGKFSLEKLDFNIGQTIDEVITIVRLQAEKKKITLHYNKNEAVESYVSGDPFRLKQILLNLLGNAVKFTDKGEIRVSVIKNNDQNTENYTFSISDTGIGIPYDMQQRIFEQFEQVDLPIEQRYEGTGLGLSITKALVEEQGGAISVKSDPGKGACFTFNIKYEKSTKAISLKSNAEFQKLNYQGEVWLVDDDNLILQLCADILSKHHIKHTCFTSARLLLDNAPETPPSVVLLDIRMPEINGIELCKALRKKYSDRTTIIALTAHALPDEKGEILKQGFNGILMKPFRENELMSLFNVSVKKNSNTANGSTTRLLHLKALEQMVSGDQKVLKKILQQYISETTHDLEMLGEAITQRKQSETTLILHRISGRTSQIGAKDIGAILRKLEISSNNNQQINSSDITNARDKVNALIAEIKMILEERKEV